jgi:hypothetical protein
VRTSTIRPQNYYARTFSGRGVNIADPGSSNDTQPGFFPAITHFTDAVDALPKEVVRHFSMLKEVEAKLHARDDHLRQLADAITRLPPPPRNHVPTQAHFPSLSAANSIDGSRNGSIVGTQQSDGQAQLDSTETADRERQQLFYQLSYNIATMAPVLDEKIAVLSTANQTLARQLERMESSYVHIPEEVSDEARLGNPKHWAYVTDKETKKTVPERTRREAGAHALAAAAAAAVAAEGEIASRSEARREAVAARKNRAQHVDSDFDDRPAPRKGPGKARKAPEDPKSVGLGITNGVQGPNKRRKVAATGAPMERSISAAMTGNVKASNGSPRETPEAPKKRTKPPGPVPRKRYVVGHCSIDGEITDDLHRNLGGQSPQIASSPVVGTFVQKETPQRPQASRGRQSSTTNSIPSVPVDSTRNRPSSSASNRPTNGLASMTAIEQLQVSAATGEPNPTESLKPPPEPVGSLKREEVEAVEEPSLPDADAPVPQAVVTTRAGRQSKTATPLASTFPDIAREARNRSARNKDAAGGGSHASSESGERGRRKKGTVAGTATGSAATSTKGAENEAPVPEERSDAAEEIEIEDADLEDADAEGVDEEGTEPKYCYCNDVSYGEMVACDNESCPREWFHLKCAGLSKAPDENSTFLIPIILASFVCCGDYKLTYSTAKWFCEECKATIRETNKRSRPGSRKE